MLAILTLTILILLSSTKIMAAEKWFPHTFDECKNRTKMNPGDYCVNLMPIDLAFVIDSINSTLDENFTEVLRKISKQTSFTYGTDKVRRAILVMKSSVPYYTAVQSFDAAILDSGLPEKFLQQSFEKDPRGRSKGRFEGTFQGLKNLSRLNGRPEVQRIVIVLTDDSNVDKDSELWKPIESTLQDNTYSVYVLFLQLHLSRSQLAAAYQARQAAFGNLAKILLTPIYQHTSYESFARCLCFVVRLNDVGSPVSSIISGTSISISSMELNESLANVSNPAGVNDNNRTRSIMIYDIILAVTSCFFVLFVIIAIVMIISIRRHAKKMNDKKPKSNDVSQVSQSKHGGAKNKSVSHRPASQAPKSVNVSLASKHQPSGSKVKR